MVLHVSMGGEGGVSDGGLHFSVGEGCSMVGIGFDRGGVQKKIIGWGGVPDICNEFMNQALKKRITFLAIKKICYECLQPVEVGHNAKLYKKRLSCITSNKRHPAPLHGYIPTNMSHW